MKKHFFAIIAFLLLQTTTFATEPVVKVTRIWNEAPHNAFTDLIRFKGKFYCVFRESAAHVPRKREEDGKIRVLVSENGKQWASLALLSEKGYDYRDPKLFVTSKGKLTVLIGASIYEDGKFVSQHNYVAFLDKAGKSFSVPVAVQIDKSVAAGNNWLWRVTWQGKAGYGVMYKILDNVGPRTARLFLMKTKDGIHYSLVAPLEVDGFPNESTVLVQPDKEMLIVVRRDSTSANSGKMGRSKPPYTHWEWADMGIRLGGPNMIRTKEDGLILGSRCFNEKKQPYTGILSVDASGSHAPLVSLPSGGDNSYPGMLVFGDTLWVSYYSSHEGKAGIYLAQIPMSEVHLSKTK